MSHTAVERQAPGRGAPLCRGETRAFTRACDSAPGSDADRRRDVFRPSAEEELVSIDGRRLAFAIRVFDEAGPIGEGRRQRGDQRSAFPRARAGEGRRRDAIGAHLTLVIAPTLSGRDFLVVTVGGLDARPE